MHYHTVFIVFMDVFEITYDVLLRKSVDFGIIYKNIIRRITCKFLIDISSVSDLERSTAS